MTRRLIQPFAAIRPAAGRAQDVAARPYDVVTTDEARAQAAGRPWSFLHVSRAEIDLDAGTDVHAPEVYAQAARAFASMQSEGVLVRDDVPCLYVYRMTAGAHVQTGLAAAASIAAYLAGRIRRHEHIEGLLQRKPQAVSRVLFVVNDQQGRRHRSMVRAVDSSAPGHPFYVGRANLSRGDCKQSAARPEPSP